MENVIRPATADPAAGTPAPDADLTGRTVGDFQVLRRLGEGGMGQVYLAEQRSLKRKVALKILKAELARNEASLKRFKAEAEAAARITHANIVQVYAIGELDGLHFMALEFVEGRNLREYLARKGTPAVPLALSIMRQVAAALVRAGEAGIVHRDVKPENILLTRHGEVKVADFGLSRCLTGDSQPLNLTQPGITMGTPLYMSPEQVQGQAVDPRSDVYSLGVTCYHMLAGQPPFQGKSAFEVALQHVQALPRPLAEVRPDLPGELCAVVDRMMAKKPEARYQSARDLLKDLNQLGDHLVATLGRSGTQVNAMSPSYSQATVLLPVATPRVGKRRRPLAWAAALSVALALAGGFGVGWFRGGTVRVPAVAEAASGGAGELSALVHHQKHEQFLVNAVKEYANPGDSGSQLSLGLAHSVELGLWYLDQWRLDDADRFFNGLMNGNVKAYNTLGRLGHAIVLAFQDKAIESNQWFVAVMDERHLDKDRWWRGRLLFGYPDLRKTVARALNHNAVNNTAAKQLVPVPPQLQPWLKPPAPPVAPRRTAGDKAVPPRM